MNYCIEAISRYIPPKNVGYRFIKRATVFIPYQEVGLSILERKTVHISFVYETVLKLLAQGVNDIDQTSLFLGLDIDIYKEIIAQMAIEDLLTVSEMSITLAPKGRQALQDLIKIVIAKSQINRIFTNLITGEIETEENNCFCDRPKPNCMCLDQCAKVNIQFFRDHFAVIEDIYSKNKVDAIIFENRNEKQDALYRILDIVYQETKYLATNCFVYVNDDDSLLFSFENDKNSLYAATAISQVSNNVVSAMNLFKSSFEMSNPQTELCHSSEKEQALSQLIGLLDQRSKTIISTEEIEAHYYTDRYILDGEIRDLLLNCMDYKPKNIIIYSAYIKDFLQDNYLIDILLSLNRSAIISFVYNSTEYNVQKSVNWILDHVSEKDKKRFSFHSLPVENSIDNTIIICNPGFVINVNYEEVKDNKQHSLLKEIADVSFDIQKINESIKMLSYVLGDFKF